MRKLTLALFALILTSVAYADTVTPTLGLIVPTIGSLSWGQKINNDLLIIDAAAAGGAGAYAILNATQTFSGSNIFPLGIQTTAINITGAGNLSFVNGPDGLTYQIIGSRITPTAGHIAVWSSSNTLVDGGLNGGGGGGSSFPNFTNDGNNIVMSNMQTEVTTNVLSVAPSAVIEDFSAATSFILPTYTLTQIQGLNATAGSVVYCSNCVTDAACVSTGGTNHFVRISARGSACN
jgi:hypothetical protein